MSLTDCLAFASVAFTAFLWWDTRRLANDTKAESTRLANAAEKSAASAHQIHESEKLLSQRQLIIPLWQHITTIREIDARAIVEPDVIKMMNALELIALCCEGGMIDKAVIQATFTDIYIRQYESIDSLPNMPGLKKDGKHLLRENRAARRFYDELKKADTEIGKLSPQS